jgi:hypothetical protein
VVSSRAGLLGEWTARNSKSTVQLDRVEVKRGDFLDFVADCRESVEFDSFHWSPLVRMEPEPSRVAGQTVREWNAKADFGGPVKMPEKRPLTAWEKYAQVLLLANELMFVD